MKNRLSLACAGLAFAASAFLAAPASANDTVEAIISSYGFQVAPLLVGKELGYFEKEGIDLNVTRVGGGAKAMAAVIGGDAQVVLAVPSSAFQANAKGAGVVAFGAVFTQIGSNFVMSKEWADKHGITETTPYKEKLKAMKGAVIGVNTAGSGGDQVARFLAKDGGLDPDRDLTISALGTGEVMTASLEQGVIQGFLQGSPVGENAIKNHGAMMFMNTVKGEAPALDGFFYIGSVASESWLKENPDVAVRYTKAMGAALDAIHDPVKTNEARDAIYAVYYKEIDKDLFDSTWANHIGAFPKTPEITQAMIDQVVSFTGKFEEPVDPAVVKATWTNEYVDKAKAQ